MKIKCPNCGNKGPADFLSEAFEVRGVWRGTPVRKCRGCGVGLLLPPFRRPRVIDPDLWARMEKTWEEEFGSKARDELLERLEEVMTPDSDPAPSVPLAGLRLLGDSDFEAGEDAHLLTAYQLLADSERQPPVPELVITTAGGMLVPLAVRGTWAAQRG